MRCQNVPILVSETDLLAFVDDQLEQDRRDEIADHLIHCPKDALRVAADLALLEGLRLLFGRPVTVPVALLPQTSFLA